MKAAYYSVFYQFLRFTFWVRTPDTQEWSALIFFAVFQCWNAFTLYAAVTYQLYPYGHRVSVPAFVGFFVAVVYGNYRLLCGNPVFQQPATVHQQPQRPAMAWLVGAYVLLTAVVGFHYSKQLHDVNVAFRH
jgi:hypothetical protein